MKTVKVTDVDPKVSDEVSNRPVILRQWPYQRQCITNIELDWGLFIVNNFETIIICGSAAEVRINPKSLYFNDKQIGWKVDWKSWEH